MIRLPNTSYTLYGSDTKKEALKKMIREVFKVVDDRYPTLDDTPLSLNELTPLDLNNHIDFLYQLSIDNDISIRRYEQLLKQKGFFNA